MNTRTAQKPTAEGEKAEGLKDGASSTALTAAAGTALAVVDIDEEDRGAGLKDIDPSERKVPFVRILQTNSPECEEGNPKFLPNAKAGMFFNTATKQAYKSLIMIPCARAHKYVEFTPRAIGGGFVAVHGPKDQTILMLRAKHGKFGKLPKDVTRRDKDGQALDGTEIIETFEVYAIFIDPETGAKFRAIATFQSTQIGKYQALVDRADAIEYRTADDQLVKPPFWAHRWLCTTATEKNKKGTFKGWVIGLFAKKEDGSDDVPIKSFIKKSDPLYIMAKEFSKFVEEGKAEVDYNAEAPAAEATEEPEM